MRVVYLLIPTSNHNRWEFCIPYEGLYIFWFLHQTTTSMKKLPSIWSCISFDSYIKPQPSIPMSWHKIVVYLLIPTSNHNWAFIISKPPPVVYLLIPTSNHNLISFGKSFGRLYIFWFLHQTTTISCTEVLPNELYIFWFLHQTTTNTMKNTSLFGCISFDSYIKPQLLHKLYFYFIVVYLLIPTSNHNLLIVRQKCKQLYIFWFLHQTTTLWFISPQSFSCISFDSYIKPQPWCYSCWLPFGCISFDSYIKPQLWWVFFASLAVVYLLIPTSNHNLKSLLYAVHQLYIFWFLHQTTTTVLPLSVAIRLYIFWFLHQTTTPLIGLCEHYVLYIFWFLHQTTTL